MSDNFVFLVKFDTCDVVYNWAISLLPSLVLDNLSGFSVNYVCSQSFLQIFLNSY